MDCLVCSLCFRIIGSVELQIGRKLFLRSLGYDSNEIEEEEDRFSIGSRDGIGQCSLSHDENHSEEEEDKQDTESSMNSNVSLPREIIESLMNGTLHLPYSNKFRLPPVASCPEGCNEACYCCKVCAEADWDMSHSFLCTRKGSKALSTDALRGGELHCHRRRSFWSLVLHVFWVYQIADGYKWLDEVTEALANAGLEFSNLKLVFTLLRAMNGQETKSHLIMEVYITLKMLQIPMSKQYLLLENFGSF